MARGSFHIPLRIVISESRLKRAAVLEANQFPIDLVAISAPCRAGEKSDDDVLTQGFEEFGLLNGGEWNRRRAAVRPAR
jgi:hypothetical protein